MIAKRFLAFVETAPWPARAAATGLLAQAYLRSPLPEDERGRIEVALTSMLDDGSPAVRRALADGFAESDCAPRHIIVALAADEPDIAAVVLERSPVLTSAELVDAVGLGRSELQVAIAGRSPLSAPVAAALAQIGGSAAALRLVQNMSADIPDFSIESMLRRHATADGFAQAVLDRPKLSREARLLAELGLAECSQRLEAGPIGAVLQGEANFRDYSEAAVLRHASECSPRELDVFVGFIRRSGLITSGLILRAFLEGKVSFGAAMMGDLAGVPRSKAEGLVDGGGFWALYKKAELPEGLRAVFQAALQARAPMQARNQKLCRADLREVVSACAVAGVTDAHPVVCMLHRMDLALAREEARETRRRVVAEVFMDEPLMLRPSTAENDRIETLAAHSGAFTIETAIIPEEKVAVAA